MDENIHQICFNVLFELSEAYTTRIHLEKTLQKPLKPTENAVVGTNILPKTLKVHISFSPAPPSRKRALYIGVLTGWREDQS